MSGESLDGGSAGAEPELPTSDAAGDGREVATDYARAVLRGLKVAWGLTSDSGILDVSPELCELTGFSRDELVGLPMPWPFWPPERIELVMRLVADVREAAATGTGTRFELPMRHRDGTRFACEVFAAPVTLPGDGQIGWVTTFQDISLRRDHEQQLERLATHDPLTALANRRLFEQRLAGDLADAVRRGRNVAVALLDLDDFKSVNDRYGHPAGDQALRETARRLRRVLRRGELLARMGGEEFAWILPETDAEGAQSAVERARRVIGGEPFPGIGTVTISIGVALSESLSQPEQVYGRADQALYRAKRDGRNRSVVWKPGMETPWSQTAWGHDALPESTSEFGTLQADG